MPEQEIQAWREFYRIYPFDDYHRFFRPAAMVAGAMGGGDITKRLQWLQPDPNPFAGDFMPADMNTFAALGIKPPRG